MERKAISLVGAEQPMFVFNAWNNNRSKWIEEGMTVGHVVRVVDFVWWSGSVS